MNIGAKNPAFVENSIFLPSYVIVTSKRYLKAENNSVVRNTCHPLNVWILLIH